MYYEPSEVFSEVARVFEKCEVSWESFREILGESLGVGEEEIVPELWLDKDLNVG